MRYFIELSYKGTNYHGWQIQNDVISVQEEIQNALSKILRKKTEITASGRTDTGVHATQQFVHFDYEEPLNADKLKYRLNSLLNKDIAVRNIVEVKEDAHARFDAHERSYEYHIHLCKSPFLDGLSYYYRFKPNLEEMNKACELLMGKKDFECFSKVKTEVNHFVCDIKACIWEQKDDKYILKITANRFLRNMVRAIVGTLLDIGENKYPAEHLLKIIESKNREKAGRSVPAEGLFLCKVSYPSSIFKK